jgi:CelD/BcsL family acetyltransferase involved in cellulose biosynthesis
MEMAKTSADGLEVRVENFESAAGLEPLWRELEARAARSFFLSWSWIGAWLETCAAKPVILAVYRQDRRVGLGLFVRGSRLQIGFPRATLFLHETGDAAKDVAMIEDNGFLAERGFERAVTRAALHYAYRAGDAQVMVGGVPDWLTEEARGAGWHDRVIVTRPCPYRVLDPSNSDDLAQLSRNTRSQISRSLRLYESRGSLAITPSATLSEARDRLAALAELHQQRWVAAGQPGAFALPIFEAFHQRVLARGFAAGEADVLRITAGADEIGYLYNFYCDNEVYAYQNGFQFADDQRLKPGLVSHLLAFAHYRRAGATRYRFLAGDSRYKRSLSTGSYDLHWLVLERDDWRRRVEALARRLRARLQAARSADPVELG